MIANIFNDRGQRVATLSASCSETSCDESFDGGLTVEFGAERGEPYTSVAAKEEQLRPILEHYKVEGGRVEMEFFTLSDRDPKTGNEWHSRDMVLRQPSPVQPPPAAQPNDAPPVLQQPPQQTPADTRSASDDLGSVGEILGTP
jgi:hypothetical protein